MKVKYFLTPKTPKDADDLSRTGAIAHLPHAGMFIDPGDGDYHKVDEVYYKPWTDTAEIYLEASSRNAKALKLMGWE